jgi:hypothetical protein
MPLSIAAWRDALAGVDKSQAVQIRTPRDRHYLFPEPGIFANTSDARRARFFATWNVVRPACIFRAFGSSSSATPLSNQQWRDFLLDGLISASQEPKLVQRCDHAKAIFAEALEELQINLTSPASPDLPDISDRKAQETLWELSELNFRFEFLALDKRASISPRDEFTRQTMILACFDVPSLVIVDPHHACTGLHSLDWRQKLPSLLAFKALLCDWDGMKPTPLLAPDLPTVGMYTECDVEQLEMAVANFYTQSFYRFFGRAAIIPTHLP